MSERDALLLAIAANIDETLPQLALADWCDEHGEPEQAAALRDGKMIVENDTYFAIRDLAQGCRMVPGSWAKRFAREMRDATTDGRLPIDIRITVTQWYWVWRLAWNYRRQVTTRTVARAKLIADKPHHKRRSAKSRKA